MFILFTHCDFAVVNKMTTIATSDPEGRCCVLGCSKTSKDKVKLHEFPFDDDSLLPIWIMATNRSDWLPSDDSRICDQHFNIDDYEDGNKSNELKPNACPMILTSTSAIGCVDATADSDNSSTSDVRMSEIGNYDTAYTDVNFSDYDSEPSESDCNWNKTRGLNDDECLTSNSEDETDDVKSQAADNIDAKALSSALQNFNQAFDQKCAVSLCSETIRKQFSNLFFIGFPTDNLPLCNEWWKLCGRSDEFDPLLKICSIHFDVDVKDVKLLTGKRNNHFIHQIASKIYNSVPTKFLMPHEFTILSDRKRKNAIEDNSRLEKFKCTVQNCRKTLLKNFKDTWFFRFPIENKILLKKWMDIIHLPNCQPSGTARVCSDHFENHDIIKIGTNYKLKKHACPSIKPKIPFVMNSGNLNKKLLKNKPGNAIEYDKKDDSSIFVGDKNENNKKRKVNNYVLTCDAYKNGQLQNEASTTQLNSTQQDFNEDKLGEENMVEWKLCAINTHSTPIITSNPCLNAPIGKTTETKIVKGIPKSILYNEELAETYGEMLFPSCEVGCKNYCFHAVPEPQRKYIFEEFQMLNDATLQNCKIAELVNLRSVKTDNNALENCPFFNLLVNGLPVKVCRLFFTNTLGISDGRLNAILNPINYSWYSDRETALKANQSNLIEFSEPMVMTDFVKESLKGLNKDYNLFEPESGPEVSLDNVSIEEYKKVLLYMKSIPRVLSSFKVDNYSKTVKFETSIGVDHMYKSYSENYILHNITPPYTKRQFIKIYNHYMKPFLITV